MRSAPGFSFGLIVFMLGVSVFMIASIKRLDRLEAQIRELRAARPASCGVVYRLPGGWHGALCTPCVPAEQPRP